MCSRPPEATWKRKPLGQVCYQTRVERRPVSSRYRLGDYSHVRLSYACAHPSLLLCFVRLHTCPYFCCCTRLLPRFPSRNLHTRPYLHSHVSLSLSLSVRGADLEKTVAEVRGGDEATALRRLAELLKSLHTDFKAARRTAESAVEAAAKCQVCRCLCCCCCRCCCW